MVKKKSNKEIKITRDKEKSYVHINEGKKDIGMLMWDYKKKKWLFRDHQKKKRSK